jgi:hypothetical protein
LGMLLPRPQLFLVEDYALETFAGPLRKGDFVETISVEARTKRTSVLITTIETAATTALKQNIIESHDNATTSAFHKALDTKKDLSASSDSYQYRMDALFHGDASAKGIWGGEVNASLNVEGGSDQQRDTLATSVFKTASEQLTNSTHVVSAKATSQEQGMSITEKVFKKEEIIVDNSMNDFRLETHLFFVIEPYVSLLVLKNVRAAYTNGRTPPEVFPLFELPRRLPELFGFIEEQDKERASKTIDYVRRELSNIRGANQRVLSILDKANLSGLEIDMDLKQRYEIDQEIDQSIETKGLIKAASEMLQPTYSVSAFKSDS